MPAKTIFVDDDGDKWTVKNGGLWYNDGHSIADAREFCQWLQSELAKTAPDDGWIEWEGGPCPVDDDALVDLTLREGDVLFRKKAGLCYWRHGGRPIDITRYRLAKGDEAAPAKPEPAKIDLTNNTTPFGLLGPEEQQALRDAYRAGRVVERWISPSTGWQTKNNAAFLNDHVCRIREEADA